MLREASFHDVEYGQNTAGRARRIAGKVEPAWPLALLSGAIYEYTTKLRCPSSECFDSRKLFMLKVKLHSAEVECHVC